MGMTRRGEGGSSDDCHPSTPLVSSLVTPQGLCQPCRLTRADRVDRSPLSPVCMSRPVQIQCQCDCRCRSLPARAGGCSNWRHLAARARDRPTRHGSRDRPGPAAWPVSRPTAVQASALEGQLTAPGELQERTADLSPRRRLCRSSLQHSIPQQPRHPPLRD